MQCDIYWCEIVRGVPSHLCWKDLICSLQKCTEIVLSTAARLLKEREQELSGTVLLIFQPAEEALAGAKHMVEEGALDGVTAVHGLHVAPSLHSGVFGTRVCAVPSYR